MQIVKVPFNQSEWLDSSDPGICNALVLEWLRGGGRPLRYRQIMHGKVVRARRGVGNATIAEYGLKTDLNRSNSYEGSALSDIQQIIEQVKKSPNKKFLIGFYGGADSDPGHAIGMIKKTASDQLGFDPNNGFCYGR